MQALESLNDGQVNDFLSGKAPLNLTMRFGDHMMLIQLQLSTVSPQASRNRAGTSSSAAASSASATATASRAVSASTSGSTTSATSTSPSTGTSSSPSTPSTRSVSTARVRRASAVIPGLVTKTASSCPASPTASRSGPGDMGPPANPPPSSSRASSASSAPSSPTASSPLLADPLASLPSAHACEALLSQLVDSATQAVQASASGCTSVSDTARTNLLRAIDPSYRTSEELKSDKGSSSSSSSSSCPSPASCPASPKQSSSPVTRKVLIRPATFHPETANASTCTSACSTPAHTSRSTSPMPSSTGASSSTSPSTNSSNTKGVQTMPCPEDSTSACTCEASRCSFMRPETRVHTRALAEASRNLMQTLKQLSSEVLTNREEEDTAAARRRQGAIIESMHNHGKGVYSGTFSGTLNPALQDRFGRPKRDISTVIHILNDLLCATPQYRRTYQGLQQSNFVLEPNSSSTSSSSSSSSVTLKLLPAPLSDDAVNQATRGKVERLRLVMEERRERRRLRREARHSPYGGSQPGPQHWTAKSETQPAGKSSEAMDTEPLCDISPPEPVVA
ncbi:hypothetical protein ONE63_002577 [Megalurothrips usitatus]|uniref:Midnolin homolog n=1 Tax=Megalurothrips usitatus TaxID=439358 RepID=A0AAV7XAW6_9NEOP|nr:hypothetical protein ONE63_002577 [Megalurothrips usitatus]